MPLGGPTIDTNGGGAERLKSDVNTRTVEPWLRVSKQDAALVVLEALEATA